jgi:hypothetical protein
MKKTILSFILVPFLQGLPSSDTPEYAANQFYSTVMAINEKGCLPDKNELRRLAPFMSKRLTTLLRDALTYREQFIKDHPPKRTKEGYLIHDKPPFIDGDCFSSNVEGVTKFTIGKSKESNGRYRIDLSLVYIDKMSSEKPFAWTDAVIVIKADGRFVVDDMEFLGDWSYGNHGLLSKSIEATKIIGR